MNLRPFLALLCVAVISCQKPSPAIDAPPKEEPVQAPDMPLEKPVPSPSVSVDAFGAFTSADRACSTLKDCEAIPAMYLNEQGHCCRSCRYEVLSQSVVEKAVAMCAARGSEGCPMKKCVAPPDFDCVQGVCTILEP